MYAGAKDRASSCADCDDHQLSQQSSEQKAAERQTDFKDDVMDRRRFVAFGCASGITRTALILRGAINLFALHRDDVHAEIPQGMVRENHI